MTKYKIAVIPGDGIGQEVIPAALTVLEAVAAKCGFGFDLKEFPLGCAYYTKHGRMMAADAFEQLADFPAIYFGAVGDPSVPDHIAVWELILPLRQRFDQYVNLRPMRLFPGVTSPLANRGPADIDMICVRENSEGEYAGIGGRIHAGTPNEAVEQAGLFTRHGISASRATRSSWRRSGRAASWRAPPSRTRSSTRWCLWDTVVDEVRKDYPGVSFKKYHVDALAARMVTHPQTLDVIVASNLFGDILTDLGAAISGSLGLAASGNINPERKYPSMFEPIHGSAPDIKGKGIANPIGAIWAGALMLDHLGERDAHDMIVAAITKVLSSGTTKTPDMGGKAATKEMAAAIQGAV